MAENPHVAFFRQVVELQKAVSLDAPHLHGLLEYIDRLRAALIGLLSFRDRKDYFDRLTDQELKPLLDAAFEEARSALGHQVGDSDADA